MTRGWGGLRSIPKATADDEEEIHARSPSPTLPAASKTSLPDPQLPTTHAQQLDNFGDPIQPDQQQSLVRQPTQTLSFGVNTTLTQPFQPQIKGPPAIPAQAQHQFTNIRNLTKRSFDPAQAPANKKAKKTAETVEMKCERCLYQKQACSGPPECKRCNDLGTVCTWVQPVTGEIITPTKAAEVEHRFPKKGGPAQTRVLANKRPARKKEASRAVVAEKEAEEGEEDEGHEDEETNTFSLGEEAAVGEIDGELYDLAPDASANLNLSWGSSRVELSHFSHGDASGVGMTSNLQHALGRPVENRADATGAEPVLGGGVGVSGAVRGVGARWGVGAGVAAFGGEPDAGELSVPTQDWELAYEGGETFW